MHQVGLRQVDGRGQGVTQDERERVLRLRLEVHADDVKPSGVVTEGRTAGATEQINE